VPKTNREKIEYLMATDKRRESHINELKKDVRNLSGNVEKLVVAIKGSELNEEGGLLPYIKEVKETVKIYKKDIEDLKDFKRIIQPQFNIGKWVFLLVSGALILGYVKEKTSEEDKKQNQEQSQNK